MIVVQDDLWFCDDCTIFAVNGDVSGIDGEEVSCKRCPNACGKVDGEPCDSCFGLGRYAPRALDVVRGVSEFGPHLVPDFDSDTGEGYEEFSRRGCDACGCNLAGSLSRFAVLGEGE